MTGLGVLDDVHEHFPHRMKQEHLHVFRELFRNPVVVKFNLEAVLVFHPFRQPPDRGLKAELIEDRRAEFERQSLRVGDRLIDEVAKIPEQLLMGLREAGFLEASDLHLAECQSLSDDIVQIGRHAPPLPFFGHGELGGEGAELSFRVFSFSYLERGSEANGMTLKLDPTGSAIDPAFLSRLGVDLRFVALGRRGGFRYCLFLPSKTLTLVGVNQVKVALCKELGPGESREGLRARVDEEQLILPVDENRGGSHLRNRAEFFFALSERQIVVPFADEQYDAESDHREREYSGRNEIRRTEVHRQGNNE